MPTQIDATFRNAQSITLDAFTPPPGQKEAPSFKNATIRVGRDAFRVSFAGDGNVSVSFATTSFFHLFQRSRKTAVRERIRELVQLKSVTEDVARAVSATGFRDNVARTIREEAGNISRAAGGKLAHYGFSDVRVQAFGIINGAAEGPNGAHVMTHQLINDYNMYIGLGDSTNAATTVAFVRDNNQGTWRYDPLARATNGIHREDQEAWIRFLRGHDIDLFSKIRQARAEAADGKVTGWAGEIARQGIKGAVLDLVRKNLDPRVVRPNPDVNLVLNAVADAVIEAVDADFTGLDVRGVAARLREIVDRHAPRGRADLAWNMFDNAATCAFWRQTSKLGLDFFKARGETVVFEWTQFDGVRSDGTELADKWWKRPEEDVRTHPGVAITNSEMRHLNGAKYAAKEGDGRVVKIEGSLSRADAEQAVRAKIDGLRALPAAELQSILASLKAGFAEMNAASFHDVARRAIASLPQMTSLGFMSHSGDFDPRTPGLIEAAFARLSARIAAAATPLAQAAMLSCRAELFEAELLGSPEVLEELRLNAPREAPAEPVSKRTLKERTLAGLGGGLGGEVFFASDTGRPNALGELLLDDGDDDVKALGEALAGSFGVKMGVSPEEALRHPAFKTFMPRAALAAHGSYDALLKSLDTVKLASDAKDALVADGHLPQPADRLFARRGEWDLNRLIFNEAVAAKAAGRAVDLAKLAKDADRLREICRGAQDFALDVARQVNPDDAEGLRLTDAERDRLEDAYLDRDRSAVVAYRRSGREEDARQIAGETATTLARTAAFVAALRTEGNGLPDDLFKGMVIDAVATRAKPVHGKVALAALEAVRAGGPIPPGDGATATERLRNFARALSDRIGTAWRDARQAAAVAMAAEDANSVWGFDDGNTSMRMFFAACLKANPEAAAFLDRTVPGADVVELMDYDRDALAAGDPLPHILELIGTHGQL